MDFNYKKPAHLFALLCLLISIGLFILLPVYSLFLPTQNFSSIVPESTPFEKTLFEIFLVIFQLGFVFLGMIIVPLLWYSLVNKISLKEMFSRLYLRRAGLDKVLLWGILAIFAAFAITIAMGFLYMFITGTDSENVGNIPDLVKLFSIPSLYLIVAIQPFCEEFFFRGFLLDKITSVGGTKIAIVSTSLLFGISHLSYTYAYTAIVAVALGLIFALVVVKTKNLYAAIFAHTIINVTSLTLYFLGQSLGY
jgi:membrane protease YdiL (CAAX protease family)